MNIRRISLAAAFAAGAATLPLAGAEAQYYLLCSPFPLSWPFCIVGAVVGTAAAIVTAPIAALTPPPYYYGYYGWPYYPPPPPPPYYPPSNPYYGQH